MKPVQQPGPEESQDQDSGDETEVEHTSTSSPDAGNREFPKLLTQQGVTLVRLDRWEDFDFSMPRIITKAGDANVFYLSEQYVVFPDNREEVRRDSDGLIHLPAAPPLPQGAPVKGKDKDVPKAQAVSPASPDKIPENQGSVPITQVAHEDTLYICTECARPRTSTHKASCSRKRAPWAPLSKAGEEERDAALNPTPDNQEKGTAQSKFSKPGEDQEEYYRQQCACVCPQRPCRHTALSSTGEPLLNKGKGKEGKGSDPAPKVDPLLKEDPLKVRTVPGPEFLALENHFSQVALEAGEPVPEVNPPKWALRAAMYSEENTTAILTGKLTRELFQAGKFTRERKQLTKKETLRQWAILLKEFAGVPLSKNARVPREKAFYKAYLELATQAGPHKDLLQPPSSSKKKKGGKNPPPKGNRNQSGGGRVRNQPAPSGAGSGGFVISQDMLSIIAGVLKLMR
jgi:hypothetical protein